MLLIKFILPAVSTFIKNNDYTQMKQYSGFMERGGYKSGKKSLRKRRKLKKLHRPAFVNDAGTV